MDRFSLLIVDDEEKTRRILELNLKNSYELHLAENGSSALALLRQHRIDIVLTDLRMPDVDGAAILLEARTSSHPIPVIIMTAFGTIDNAVAMMKDGAFDYILKPVNLDQLDIALVRAQLHVQLLRENEQLRSQLRSIEGVENIVTANVTMQGILKTVREVAATHFTVLIEGETGTGKELIARAVHALSSRSTQAFVAVNCGAIPRELLESEFFGSERGAFTGAMARRAGKFEQANQGSLLLDEIGELPPDLQVKLLRALEEQAIVRIGGTERVPLDVRIIAATNKRLRLEMEAGRFRSDLFYRINVMTLTLPPLRDRAEDIPLLAQHFLLKHRDSVGKELKGFESAVLAYLRTLPWPGNVRELENVVIRAMVAARGDYVTLDDLPRDVRPAVGDENDAAPSTYRTFLTRKKGLRDEYLKSLERSFVLKGLLANQRNVSKTARALGMDRRLLQNMMRHLEIKPEDFDAHR
jgi:DNA-binding NtrC family response regulator